MVQNTRNGSIKDYQLIKDLKVHSKFFNLQKLVSDSTIDKTSSNKAIGLAIFILKLKHPKLMSLHNLTSSHYNSLQNLEQILSSIMDSIVSKEVNSQSQSLDEIIVNNNLGEFSESGAFIHYLNKIGFNYQRQQSTSIDIDHLADQITISSSKIIDSFDNFSFKKKLTQEEKNKTKTSVLTRRSTFSYQTSKPEKVENNQIPEKLKNLKIKKFQIAPNLDVSDKLSSKDVNSPNNLLLPELVLNIKNPRKPSASMKIVSSIKTQNNQDLKSPKEGGSYEDFPSQIWGAFQHLQTQSKLPKDVTSIQFVEQIFKNFELVSPLIKAYPSNKQEISDKLPKILENGNQDYEKYDPSKSQFITFDQLLELLMLIGSLGGPQVSFLNHLFCEDNVCVIGVFELFGYNINLTDMIENLTIIIDVYSRNRDKSDFMVINI